MADDDDKDDFFSMVSEGFDSVTRRFGNRYEPEDDVIDTEGVEVTRHYPKRLGSATPTTLELARALVNARTRADYDRAYESLERHVHEHDRE